MPNSLQDHFWRGEEQTTSYSKNYRKACVKNQMQNVTRVIEKDELLMQALTEELEDDVPDDGAIEIDSEDEYHA
ncbi:hypothetical protein DFH09DRAFT_1331957 [Mycena vulgaris]|nr:hypothetical protein DFH09DRAFT_1331957 [Mycena vulgaris]